MNTELYQAAREAGCSRAESEALAIYVEVDSVKATAHRMGIRPHTASQYLGRVKERLDVPHIAAAVARLATRRMD